MPIRTETWDNGELAAYYWARDNETGLRYAKTLQISEEERERAHYAALREEQASVARRLEQLDQPTAKGWTPEDPRLVQLRRDELKETEQAVTRALAYSAVRLAELSGETGENMLPKRGRK